MRRSDAPADDPVEHAFDDTGSTVVRAGIVDAPTPDGEFGIITAARLSPDGRWIAVRDEVAPHIKMVDSSGAVAWTLSFDGDTAQNYVPPVIALSNRSLLVFREGVATAELYDHRGRLTDRIDGVDFTPLSATALSDSVWMVYGPSRGASAGGTSWLHCLRMHDSRHPTWTSFFVDSAAGAGDLAPDVGPVMASFGNIVVFEHVARASSVVSASCGTDATPASAARIAQARPLKRASSLAASPLQQYTKGLDTRGFAVVNLAVGLYAVGLRPAYSETRMRLSSWLAPGSWMHPLKTARVAAVSDAVTSFERIDASGTPAIDVPRGYWVLDARAEIGVLFSTHPPTFPELELVRTKALSDALARRAPRRGSP